MPDIQRVWLTEQFDERQRKEIGFCREYAKNYAHGTDGHNAKLIIAKMADLLDRYYWEPESAGPQEEVS